LTFEIWRLLGGSEKAHVTLNNLRIFLLAIMGTFIEPALKKEEQELVKIGKDTFGQFNEHGDLFLDTHEVGRIQKVF